MNYLSQFYLPAWWPGTLVVFVGLVAILYSLYRRRSLLVNVYLGNTRIFLLMFVLSMVVPLIPSLSIVSIYKFLDLGVSSLIDITPFAYVPIIIASGWWGSASAVLLALSTSIVYVWSTGLHLFTILEWCLVAVIVTFLLRQDYIGRLPKFARNPIVASSFASLVVWPVQLASLILDRGPTGLLQLDLLASIWSAGSLPLLINLLVSGFCAEIVKRLNSRMWFNRSARRIPPYAINLNRRMLFALLPVAIVGIGILFWANTQIALNSAKKLVVDQMTRDAENAADVVPFFIRTGERLMLDLADDDILYDGNNQNITQYLLQGIGTIPYFGQLIYFDSYGRAIAGYPQNSVESVNLSTDEISAVQNVLQDLISRHEIVYPNEKDSPVLISFVTPVYDEDTGLLYGALLGRANIVSSPLMIPAMRSLQGVLVGSGIGFIVDHQDRIIYHPDPDMVKTLWKPDLNAESIENLKSKGVTYRDRNKEGLTRFTFYLPVEEYPWKIIIVVPLSAVLVQATEISFPLTLLLLVFGVIGLVVLLAISRRLTLPLGLLASASEKISEGNLSESVAIEGPDEVGRLGEAFERMRIRVRSQVDELSMLLDVSRSVSGSLQLEECLPPMLSGALKVTDAVGARLILKGFDQRNAKKEVFSAGFNNVDMHILDDNIFELVESEGQMIVLENVARARAVLDLYSNNISLQAIIAVPVQHESTFIGVLWLGYENPHIFSRSESDLLITLAGQAAVAIANAKLFEASEGGRQQLDAILTATPDAIIVTDPRLRLVMANPAAKDIFDLQDRSVIGRRINEIIHQPQLAVALRSSDEHTSSHEINLPDGRTFSGSTTSILRKDGSVIALLAVLRDVTEFKELDQQKTDAIEAVSNDLKAPLAQMQGYSTMLPMVGKLNERQKEFAEKISDGVEHMSTLIEDVLDLHRIESMVSSNMEDLDIGVVLQEQVDQMKSQAITRGIQLVYSVGVGLDKISGDKTMLSRAVRHLLDNAIRCSANGDDIQINVQIVKNNIEVAVIDNGIGISRADQDRLFQKFYRVQGQQVTESLGSGLGLSLVKSIIELHGGHVWLESQLGVGSTFFFSIPIKRD